MSGSEQKKFMNIKELSGFLNVPESTVRYWVFCKKIPYNKLGKSIRFSFESIKTWLENQEVRQGGQ